MHVQVLDLSKSGTLANSVPFFSLSSECIEDSNTLYLLVWLNTHTQDYMFCDWEKMITTYST